jgi:hypothetical protein
MEATYIKNKGVTQTTIQDNHHHTKTNEIKWDADYNGKYANIKLDVADNGKKNKYRIKMDNKDLANMLNVSSVNRPIDQRLEMDFLKGHMEPEMQVDLQQIHTPKSFILPQLKPALEPEPMLYRVNIPQKKNTMSLENQLLDIDRELSELSSIMVEGNTDADTYGNLIPKVLTQKVVNPISRKRNKTKNMLYKTPLPKTVRIHYKTPRQNRKKNQKNQKKKTRKYNKREPKLIQNQNQQLFSNFFRNLTK